MAYLNSEAELAAVLGHEIGHVTARHGVRQQSAAQAANIGLTIASIFVPEINNNLGQNLSNVISGALCPVTAATTNWKQIIWRDLSVAHRL